MHLLARVFLLSTTVGSVACSGALGPRPTPYPEVVHVVVDNQYPEDVRVYLVRGDTPIFVGTVGSLERRDFSLGPDLLPLLTDVRLKVRARDGRTFAAPAMMVDRGQKVVWRLGTAMGSSVITVR